MLTTKTPCLFCEIIWVRSISPLTPAKCCVVQVSALLLQVWLSKMQASGANERWNYMVNGLRIQTYLVIWSIPTDYFLSNSWKGFQDPITYKGKSSSTTCTQTKPTWQQHLKKIIGCHVFCGGHLLNWHLLHKTKSTSCQNKTIPENHNPQSEKTFRNGRCHILRTV